MSPLSSGPMRGGIGRYIFQASPLSGPMRGSVQSVHLSSVTTIRAYERGGVQSVHLSSVATIIRAYERGEGVQSVHLSNVTTITRANERRVQPVHLSSVTTIIRVYQRGGFSRNICQESPLSSGPIREGWSSDGTSVKCPDYHQGV